MKYKLGALSLVENEDSSKYNNGVSIVDKESNHEDALNCHMTSNALESGRRPHLAIPPRTTWPTYLRGHFDMTLPD